MAGIVVVLPAWLAVLLLVKLLVHLSVLVKPITKQLPDGVNHPQVAASLVFVLICLAVGLLFQSSIGRSVGKKLAENVFNHIPGYQPLRDIARQFNDMGARAGFNPALIEVEDGCLAPAFLIEIHANGHSTVFVPSVPTPMAGSIFIMPSERVHTINVPVTTMMKCISKWGSGSSELVTALQSQRQEIL